MVSVQGGNTLSLYYEQTQFNVIYGKGTLTKLFSIKIFHRSMHVYEYKLNGQER